MCVFCDPFYTHKAVRTVRGVWSIPKIGLKFVRAPLWVSVKRQVFRALLEAAGASTGAGGGTGGDTLVPGVAVTGVAATGVAATG